MTTTLAHSSSRSKPMGGELQVRGKYLYSLWAELLNSHHHWYFRIDVYILAGDWTEPDWTGLDHLKGYKSSSCHTHNLLPIRECKKQSKTNDGRVNMARFTRFCTSTRSLTHSGAWPVVRPSSKRIETNEQISRMNQMNERVREEF